MAACHVAAFFRVGKHHRFALYRELPVSPVVSSERASSTALQPFVQYECSILSFAGPISLADVRPPTPFEGEVIPNGTIVYVDGTIFIREAQDRSFIDATQLTVIVPPTSTPPSSYPAGYFDGVGRVEGPYVTVPSGAWLFPLTVSQFVRNHSHSFKIGYSFSPSFPCFSISFFFSCLINKQHFHWQNSDVPPTGTVVYFSGHALPVENSPIVVLEVDAFFFDFSFQKLPSIEPPPNVVGVDHTQKKILCAK
jgi:hypothetical protein